MVNNKIIVMPVYRRPDYTKQVLDGIKSCYGSDEYKVIICAEPGYPDVIDVIEDFKGLDIFLMKNHEKLKIGGNVLKCLNIGFSQSDYVIVLEDDFVPSKDFLKYHEWAANEYKNDKNVLSVTGYNNSNELPHDLSPELYYSVDRLHWFTCIGWGTWVDRWDNELKPNWRIDGDAGTWTTIIIEKVLKNMFEIKPYFSRVQNIGLEGGVHEINKSDHEKFRLSKYYVNLFADMFDKRMYNEINKTTDKNIEETKNRIMNEINKK
jgi:hypothetical protein